MNLLQQLIWDRVFSWPEGVDMLCVSKRSQWMLRHARGEATVGTQTSALFAKLGPCSNIYRHMAFSRSDYEKLRTRRGA